MDSAMLHRWGKPDIILVATNLHDAPHLVPHAIAQAKLSRAKVLLAHVIEASYLRTNPAEGLPFVLPSPPLRTVQTKLNEIVKQFQEEGTLCEPIVLKGLPGEQIPALLHERRVDRVIVGTRSAEGLDRILLGSVADDLLHQLDVPVCVVGPHVRPQISPNRKPASMLVATSFRHQDHPSIRVAVELAKLYQSQLTLVHVMSSEQASDDERQRLRQRATDELAGAATEGGKRQVSLKVMIRVGDPSDRILAVASRVRAELIVLGAMRASKSSRMLAAGVVHRVVAEARAPVIVVRQEQGVSKNHIELLTA